MTVPHLFNHFKDLMEEFGWDGVMNGGSHVARFVSANRNHIDEFIGLASLMPNVGVRDTSEWLPHEDKDKWSYSAYSSDNIAKPAVSSVPLMLKQSLKG